MKNKKNTPPRLRLSIKSDAVHPSDYFRYKFPSSCEDCSHFNRKDEICTFGYNSQWHRKEYQEYLYRLNGRMTLCRFLEID